MTPRWTVGCGQWIVDHESLRRRDVVGRDAIVEMWSTSLAKYETVAGHYDDTYRRTPDASLLYSSCSTRCSGLVIGLPPS